MLSSLGSWKLCKCGPFNNKTWTYLALGFCFGNFMVWSCLLLSFSSWQMNLISKKDKWLFGLSMELCLIFCLWQASQRSPGMVSLPASFFWQQYLVGSSTSSLLSFQTVVYSSRAKCCGSVCCTSAFLLFTPFPHEKLPNICLCYAGPMKSRIPVLGKARSHSKVRRYCLYIASLCC